MLHELRIIIFDIFLVAKHEFDSDLAITILTKLGDISKNDYFEGFHKVAAATEIIGAIFTISAANFNYWLSVNHDWLIQINDKCD